MAPPDVIHDSGPSIHLDELGCLGLLADFRNVFVQHQVWPEVEHHTPQGDTLQSACRHIAGDIQTMARALALGIGDQAAISLMPAHPQATC